MIDGNADTIAAILVFVLEVRVSVVVANLAAEPTPEPGQIIERVDCCYLKSFNRTGIVAQLSGLHHALNSVAIEVKCLHLRSGLELGIELLPIRQTRNHGAFVGIPLQADINVVGQNWL